MYNVFAIGFQDILTQPVQPVLSTTSVEEKEKGREDDRREESCLHQLINKLSAAEWVSQTELKVRACGVLFTVCVR